MIYEIGERESRELLREQKIGRLGCSANGETYVTPVNYYFDGENLYIHSLFGCKIEIMRANPRVCFQVDDIRDDYHWRSVLAFGRFEEINDATERSRILGALFKKLPHLTPIESRMNEAGIGVIVFRIPVERITGVGEHWV